MARFDCTWLRDEEIMQLNPEVLHDFHRRHSPEVNFSKPGRVDENSCSSWTMEDLLAQEAQLSYIVFGYFFIVRLFSLFSRFGSFCF